jgi:hypothetical protein
MQSGGSMPTFRRNYACLLGLPFGPEDGGSTLPRNVIKLAMQKNIVPPKCRKNFYYTVWCHIQEANNNNNNNNNNVSSYTSL